MCLPSVLFVVVIAIRAALIATLVVTIMDLLYNDLLVVVGLWWRVGTLIAVLG